MHIRGYRHGLYMLHEQLTLFRGAYELGFDRLKLDVKPIGYRVLPSTNNNTHVIIYLDKAITDLEELSSLQQH